MQAQNQHSLRPPSGDTLLARWGSEAARVNPESREGGPGFPGPHTHPLGWGGKLAILLADSSVHLATELHLLPPDDAESAGVQGWDRMAMSEYSREGTHPGWVELWDRLELAEEETSSKEKSGERKEKPCGHSAFWNSSTQPSSSVLRAYALVFRFHFSPWPSGQDAGASY